MNSYLVCPKPNLAVFLAQNRDYNVEIIEHLFSQAKIQTLFCGELNSDYLFSMQKQKVTPNMRKTLVYWMLELSEELRLTYKSREMALLLLDIVLSSILVDKSVLQLVGITALYLAIKVEENFAYSLDHAKLHSACQYNTHAILEMEQYILYRLNWNLNIVTPGELMRLLLLISNSEYDFTAIIEKADSFISLCLSEYTLSGYGSQITAVASILCSLEHFRMIDFRNDWLSQVHEKFVLDVDALYNCKMEILNILFNNVADDSSQKIKIDSPDFIHSLLKTQSDFTETAASSTVSSSKSTPLSHNQAPRTGAVVSNFEAECNKRLSQFSRDFATTAERRDKSGVIALDFGEGPANGNSQPADSLMKDDGECTISAPCAATLIAQQKFGKCAEEFTASNQATEKGNTFRERRVGRKRILAPFNKNAASKKITKKTKRTTEAARLKP